MEQRINAYEKDQGMLKAMFGLSGYLAKSPIEKSLLHLVELRASQINGCAFCLDMHSKDLRAEGETEQRLYLLEAWRESPFYTERERAALAWTEVLTKLPEHGVPDDIYERVRSQFSEKELSDLTFDVMVINGWNRANVAFKTVPGSSDKAFGLDKANLV